jgi:hypothetical protein
MHIFYAYGYFVTIGMLLGKLWISVATLAQLSLVLIPFRLRMHFPLFIGQPIDVIDELCYRGCYSCKTPASFPGIKLFPTCHAYAS